jgi:hypothetical protein
MITQGAVVVVVVVAVVISMFMVGLMSISGCFDVDADQEESPRAKCLMVRPNPGLTPDGRLSSSAGERAEPERSERSERAESEARDSERITV